MHDLSILLIHLLATIIKLMGPGKQAQRLQRYYNAGRVHFALNGQKQRPRLPIL